MLAYRTPYLDTSVYIAAIKGPTTEDPQRVAVSARILAEAEADRLRIIASTFIYAEVIRDRGEEAPLDPEKITLVDRFLDRPFISWVELDIVGGRLARKLVRRYGVQPPDAVHLAAAIIGKADVFFTWDDKLMVAVDGAVDGLPVSAPYVFQGPQATFDFFASPQPRGATQEPFVIDARAEDAPPTASGPEGSNED